MTTKTNIVYCKVRDASGTGANAVPAMYLQFKQGSFGQLFYDNIADGTNSVSELPDGAEVVSQAEAARLGEIAFVKATYTYTNSVGKKVRGSAKHPVPLEEFQGLIRKANHGRYGTRDLIDVVAFGAPRAR